MPKFGKDSGDLQKFDTGHFGFSAVKVDELGASEYTLVTLVNDRSGSTSGFQNDMEKVLKNVLKACARLPRADNLMLRLVVFEDDHQEVHGFKLLSQCNPDDYTGVLAPGGMTALYDSAVDAIEATNNYGKELSEQDFDCNAIVIVTTDGLDNRSKCTPNQVKEALSKCVTDEHLESVVSILVAVGSYQELQDFHDDAGFTQYVELGDADEKTLAKLTGHISQSISSTSQALGSGGVSGEIQTGSINF